MRWQANLELAQEWGHKQWAIIAVALLAGALLILAGYEIRRRSSGPIEAGLAEAVMLVGAWVLGGFSALALLGSGWLA